MKKKILDIDDSYASQSKLELTTVPELKSVNFSPVLQYGICSDFSLHVVDIDEMVEFLIKAKEELKNE